MAVVRITEQLKTDVRAIAGNKFLDRIRVAEESAPTTAAWGDYIYQTLLGAYLPIMEQLPADFFPHVNTISIRGIQGRVASLNFPLSTERVWPANLPPGIPAERTHYNYGLTLKDHPVWTDLAADVFAWMDRCVAIRNERREFVDGVSKVLDSFSTLAPALKAWPPLWELLPDYAKNKHKEIVSRSKPEKVEPALDVGKITAVMVASKLK